MSHFTLRPRWRKVLRDLGANKTRTALVVLSLVVGLFTISLLITAEGALRSNFNREFAAVNPSSARLMVPGGFDDKFVQAVRRMPGVQDAEGLRSTTVACGMQVNVDRETTNAGQNHTSFCLWRASVYTYLWSPLYSAVPSGGVLPVGHSS